MRPRGALAPQARRPAPQPTHPAHGRHWFDPVAHSLKLLRDDGAGELVPVVYGRAAGWYTCQANG